MLMPIDRKFCDCSTLYMTCFKIVNNTFQTSNQILCFPWAISELFSIASASVITFILKAIVYEEQRAFGTMRKITARREILNWNNCQVTVTESIVVFLQSHGSDYIFTDSLFSFVFILSSLAFVFSEPFPNDFHKVRWLKWLVTIKNSALSL